MLTKEQRIDLLGILATISVTSVGLAIGGTIGTAVMAGIGINLSSSIIQNGFVKLKERWLRGGDGIRNNDIRQALVRAFGNTLVQLETEYFTLSQANALPQNEKESIRQLFAGLRQQGETVFSTALEQTVNDEVAHSFLVQMPETAADRLWERVDKAGLLYTYSEHFSSFFQRRFPQEMQLQFSDQLKTDNRECNRAWRAFQWLMLEGIQEDIESVQAGQEEIQRDLQKLDELRCRVTELKGLVERRLPDEPFQRELETAIRRMQSILLNVAATAERIETKVGALETDVRTVSETARLVEEEVRTIAMDVKDVKDLVSMRVVLPRPKLLDNLPSRRTGHFIGRHAEKERIHKGFQSGVARTLISGSGGMGKTTLALEVAHECLEQEVFEVVVWNTTESGGELTLNRLLDTIAQTLYLEGYRQLPEEDKALLILRAMRVFRTLLIVDGYETIADSRIREFLQKLPSTSLLLTTSRYLYAVPEEELVFLREMSIDEALKLIRVKSRMRRLANASKKTLSRLHKATGGMPLALEWAIGQVNTGRQSIESVIHGLEAAKAEAVYDKLFSASYEHLTDSEKQVLWSLSMFVGSATKPALQSVSRLSSREIEVGLRQLIEMSLVYSNEEFEESRIRYSVHPLLRNFARGELRRQPAPLTGGYAERFVDYFSEYAEKEIAPLVERKQIHGRSLEIGVEDLSATMQWAEAELDNIRATMDLCYQRNHLSALMRLVKAMSYFYATRGYWNERIRRGHQAAEIAAEAEDRKEEAWMYANEIGYLLMQQGKLDEAEELILRGRELLGHELEMLEKTGKIESDAHDQQGVQFTIGLVHRYLGILYTKKGEYKAAKEAFEEALGVFKQLDRESIIANQKTEMGDLALRQGDCELAERYYQESLDYHDGQKDQKPWVYSWMARACNGLGDIAYERGELSAASKEYQKGLNNAQKARSLDGIAYSEYRLAHISESKQEYQTALRLAEEAQDILSQAGRSDYAEDLEEMIGRLREHLDRIQADGPSHAE